MKQYKLLFFILLLSAAANAQQAESVSLNLYGGYTFQDRVEYRNAYGYVKDGFEYGAGFEYFLANDYSLELKYQRLDTKMPLYAGQPRVQVNAGDDKGALNYILLDGTRYFGSNTQKALPYLGAGAGIGIIETPQNGSRTNFAWDIKAGVKIKTASAVSVNLNAYLQSVASAAGNGYYNSPVGIVAVTEYVATYQFGLGAVLSFNFKG